MKDKITYDEYLIVVGLSHLARGYYKKADEFERELACFLGKNPEDDYYCGHISDFILMGEMSLDRALELEKVTVLPNPPQQPDTTD